jgi:hypothetical protein
MIRVNPRSLLWLLTLAAASNAHAADLVARKQARAARVPEASIRIDGVLDEAAWSQAIPITDFVQKEPQEGAAPLEGTEVRILYDDDAIYVGARMENRSRLPIQAPMGRRDGVEEQSEYLLLSLDTFLDRRTAYAFGVSASGIRMDRYHPQDDETTFDEDFNPVWHARTSIGEDSWTAELWIPFSQLRFNDQAAQVWGMNLQRFAPTRNEMDYWSPVPRTVEGWASRFGDLHGIEGLRPRKRIEVLPYVGAAATTNGNRDSRNPFDDGRNLTSRTGLDLKMGIGPNLTLDATFNPDFGQVEADPSEVNLTAIETIFVEKRPFFVEGVRLLNMVHATNFFYSRRIGATPETPASGDFVDYPKETRIVGAAKLTGRLRSGTSLGFLGAVTDQAFAQTATIGSAQIDRVRVAPRTAYALLRVQQEFGTWGSTVAAMATATHRDLAPDDPLSALLARNALALAGDSIVRFRNGQYQLRPFIGATLVRGEPSAISRIQRSSVHYLQRPDRTDWKYDPTRTSLAGYKWGLAVERTGGRHWLWSGEVQTENPGFEANDIGRLSSADGVRVLATVRYRETVPGKRFRNYFIGVNHESDWNFAGNRQVGTLRGEFNVTFPNFWSANLLSGPNLRLMSATLTRGGPLMGGPGGWTTIATLKNRAAARTVWTGTGTITTDELGGGTRSIVGSVSLRPGKRWQVSLAPTYLRQDDYRQYVATLGGGVPDTFGQRYVFGFIERSTLSAQLRVGFTLKPDVNIDLYAEPFAASGRYDDFGELPASRAQDLRVYGTEGTTISRRADQGWAVTDGLSSFALPNRDFNVRSFRSSLVARWEWKPGSTLHLVWQQNRRESDALAQRAGVSDLFSSLRATGSNYFVVKLSFWAPFQ